MALLTWYDSFSVGIEKIDDQHKKFFELVNDVYSAMETNKGSAAIDQILKELQDYVVYHFNTEESWMETCNYPEIEDHRRIHREAVMEVNKLILQYQQVKKEILFDLLKFLSDWIRRHILEIDRKYIPYLQKDA